jgi:GTP pyrophosphokinase
LDENEGRLIKVDLRQSDQGAYPVVVRVEAFDRSGLVHDISGIVAAENVNMISASATTAKDRLAVITATLEISAADQLTRILNKIERLPNVVEARRITA